MFSLIRNLMTGKYGVFWQVMLAGLLLMAIWQGYAADFAQKLFFFLATVVGVVVDIFVRGWEKDGVFGVILGGIFIIMCASPVFFVCLGLYFFLEHPLVTFRFLGGKFREFISDLGEFTWEFFKFSLLMTFVGVSAFALYILLTPLDLRSPLSFLIFLAAVGIVSFIVNAKWSLSDRFDAGMSRLLRVFKGHK